MTLPWRFAHTPSQLLVYSGIIVEAMRDSWTDDRMDDLARRMDTGFAQVREDFTQVREEIAGLRADNHEEISGLRADNKEEIAGLRADNKEGIAGLRADSHEDIAGLRTDNRELRRDMAALDRDLRAKISQSATREELQQGFDALNHRFDAMQRTLIAAILAGFIGLLATHFG